MRKGGINRQRRARRNTPLCTDPTNEGAKSIRPNDAEEAMTWRMGRYKASMYAAIARLKQTDVQKGVTGKFYGWGEIEDEIKVTRRWKSYDSEEEEGRWLGETEKKIENGDRRKWTWVEEESKTRTRRGGVRAERIP